MISINLLPWREQQRARQQYLICVSAFISMCSVFVIIVCFKLYLHHTITHQLNRINLLNKELGILAAQLQEIKKLDHDKKEIQAKIVQLAKVQHARMKLVHVLDELTKIIPRRMSFYQLDHHHDRFLLRGYAQSNKSISLFLRRINKNNWLHTPVLIEIKKREEDKEDENEFFLSFLANNNQLSIIW